ncbi:hypothetical protein [Pseudomonas lactis]|uniref:hypothetical protein n=1 Tax=Pseudomonas lactis TaxID=1615674 RepID=UPI0014760BBB|nr:hypothetical protein [Pseudomonas lactis]NNA49771.1 hypothetical protein [Pseudomonas lactis]
MANLPETEDFAAGTYQIETSDRVLGGPGGIANKQAEQLGNRTAWLKAALTKILDGVTAVGKATQLATARTLRFKGAVSGSGTYDGSVDTEITLTLTDSGLAPGAYTRPVFNVKGIAIGGTNPTTLAGYGITDAIPNINPLPGESLDLHGGPYAFVTAISESSVCQNCYYSGNTWLRHDIGKPAICITVDGGQFYVRRAAAGQNPINWQTMSPVWDASNAKFSGLLERPTTLAGYSISDAFTRAETNANIDAAIARLIGAAPGAVDTIEELARALNNNPNFATDVINGLATKANKATTLQGYGITDALQNVNPLPGGSIDIHGTAYGFLTAQSEASLCQNCYWNGNVWMRHNTSAPAVSITADNGRVIVRKAAAGANPIAWGTVRELWDSGSATFPGLLNKPTTIDGYGITDAIKNVNPLPGGSIDIHGAAFGFLTAQSEASLCQNCYWNGNAWMRHNTSAPAVSITADNGRVTVRKAPAGANPIAWGAVRELWDSGNATFANLSGKPTSIDGYGITDAIKNINPLSGGSIDLHAAAYGFLSAQEEASVCQNCYWDGSVWMRHDTSRAASTLTVSNGQVRIRSVAAGANPIAWVTDSPVWHNAAVTTSLSSSLGILALPNGWMQQVFEVTESTSANDYRYFPLEFPNGVFGVFPVLLSSTIGSGWGTNVGVVTGNWDKQKFLLNGGGSFSSEGRFRILALGW